MRFKATFAQPIISTGPEALKVKLPEVPFTVEIFEIGRSGWCARIVGGGEFARKTSLKVMKATVEQYFGKKLEDWQEVGTCG